MGVKIMVFLDAMPYALVVRYQTAHHNIPEDTFIFSNVRTPKSPFKWEVHTKQITE